jgi:hypothetical protein
MLLILVVAAVIAMTAISGARASRESFCEQCDAKASRDKPGTPCECQAYCCSVGYEFSDGSICDDAKGNNTAVRMAHTNMDSLKSAACDDACVHCSDIKESLDQTGARDICFSSCCELDVFSHSCKMWKFNSTLETSVIGSEHVILAGATAMIKARKSTTTTRNAQRLTVIEKRTSAEVAREMGTVEARGITTSLNNAKKISSPPINKSCAMTSHCKNYCDAYSSPPTPVRSVCSVPIDLSSLVQGTATCAGWGCTEATREHADEGCFCCCSSYRAAKNKDECEISSSFGTCIQFCASHKRNLMPLSCSSAESDNGMGGQCGGVTCAERDDKAGSDGCFCCCVE